MRKNKAKVSALGSPTYVFKITDGPSRRQIARALFDGLLRFVVINIYRDPAVDAVFVKIITITVNNRLNEVLIYGPVASLHLIKRWGARVRIKYSLHTRRGTIRFYKR